MQKRFTDHFQARWDIIPAGSGGSTRPKSPARVVALRQAAEPGPPHPTHPRPQEPYFHSDRLLPVNSRSS